MNIIRTILHPTDFSANSERAFQLACALARDYKARLLLVHVASQPVNPPLLYPVPPTTEVPVEEPLEKLRQMQSACGDVATASQVREGGPAGEILTAAKEGSADVIVMGTHGRTGLGHLLMGSVAEEVVRQAPCPVLTLRVPALPEEPDDPAAEAVRHAILP